MSWNDAHLIPLVIWKRQIKTTVRYRSTSTQVARIQKTNKTMGCKDVEQPEMYIAGENAILEKSLTMPTEVIHALPVNLRNPISKNKNIYSYKYYDS